MWALRCLVSNSCTARLTTIAAAQRFAGLWWFMLGCKLALLTASPPACPPARPQAGCRSGCARPPRPAAGLLPCPCRGNATGGGICSGRRARRGGAGGPLPGRGAGVPRRLLWHVRAHAAAAPPDRGHQCPRHQERHRGLPGGVRAAAGVHLHLQRCLWREAHRVRRRAAALLPAAPPPRHLLADQSAGGAGGAGRQRGAAAAVGQRLPPHLRSAARRWGTRGG